MKRICSHISWQSEHFWTKRRLVRAENCLGVSLVPKDVAKEGQIFLPLYMAWCGHWHEVYSCRLGAFALAQKGMKDGQILFRIRKKKSWKYATPLNYRIPVPLNYRVRLSFRKWTSPSPCWRSWMSLFLPDRIFPWSRQVQKLRNLPWNGSVTIQSPLSEYHQLFKQRGGLGVWGSGPNHDHNEVLAATKKLKHISLLFMARGLLLTLWVICFIIQKQYFKAKLFLSLPSSLFSTGSPCTAVTPWKTSGHTAL